MSTRADSRFATIEEALDDIREGKMVVVCDDEDRENEGDLTMAAQFATPEAINSMRRGPAGRTALPLPPKPCTGPGLALMAPRTEPPSGTPSTVPSEPAAAA